METGTVLLTKDGRKVGNAIVLRMETSYGLTYNVVKTDFGNIIKLKDSEIRELFYIDVPRVSEHSLSSWMEDRARLLYRVD